MNKLKKNIKKIIIILAWLGLFEIAAMLVHNSILLVGPIAVAKTLAGLLVTKDFYLICLMSLWRIFLGMLLAFVFGIICGALIYRYEWFEDVLEPILSVMKSIPVASFVVLLLIWQGASDLSVFISFFVVFPNICVSMKNGLKAVDVKMMEMAQIFHIKGMKKLLYIYRPTLVPYLISCMEISIGMSFKSGVAAEVIGTPDYSIGERIYVSKVYLDTAGLFAWTLSLIVLSFLVEKVVLYLMRLTLRPMKEMKSVLMSNGVSNGMSNGMSNGVSNGKSDSGEGQKEYCIDAENDCIQITSLCKQYDNKSVLDQLNKKLKKGGIYTLMAPSGSGKTTLFRIIAGLENADSGNVSGVSVVSYQFQEDRLVEKELTINNIMLTGASAANLANIQSERNQYKNTTKLSALSSEILPTECLRQPVSELSGGMKRRVALLRAVLFHFDNPNAVCLLDEPFSGLDEETKKKTIEFIKKYQNGRTFIIATHEEEDCELLGGTLWKM